MCSVREIRCTQPSRRTIHSLYRRRCGRQAKVQRWGNSLGLRILSGLAEEVGLGSGTEVSFTAEDGELFLRPSLLTGLRLPDLLAGITPANIHGSVDSGDAVGNEAFRCLQLLCLSVVIWCG